MSDIQNQVSARVEAFVAEITELARAAAYAALNSALEQSQAGAAPSAATARPRSRGGKRSPEELASMADAFLDYVTKNPGQRMEQIAKELGYRTPELNLPVKKLVSAGKLRVEGQKRATQYYPAEGGGAGAAQDTARRGSKTAKRGSKTAKRGGKKTAKRGGKAAKRSSKAAKRGSKAPKRGSKAPKRSSGTRGQQGRRKKKA